MNKLTTLAGIVTLSLASLISGCSKDEGNEKNQKNTEPSYSCLLELRNDEGDLIRTDTLIYPIVFKGNMVFDKNNLGGPYTLQGHFHFGAGNKIIYHPNKKQKTL